MVHPLLGMNALRKLLLFLYYFLHSGEGFGLMVALQVRSHWLGNIQNYLLRTMKTQLKCLGDPASKLSRCLSLD